MTKTALEEIRELYDQIPDIACKGLCANSCGPIDMSDAERSRLVDLGVTIPVFTSEAGRLWGEGARLDCPALTPMRTCQVYEDRPMICRLWGVSESMPCTWGCQPVRELSDAECYDLIFKANEIGGHPLHGKVSPQMRARMEEFQADAELGPLFARFIRGESHVEAEMVRIIAARRAPAPRSRALRRRQSGRR